MDDSERLKALAKALTIKIDKGLSKRGKEMVFDSDSGRYIMKDKAPTPENGDSHDE